MKTAVVILNYNTRNLLETFLPVVLEKSKNHAEVIVADNASTDDSVACMREKFPNVKLIVNKENGGYAKGYNDCLKHVDAEYLLLLNSDVEVTDNWLEPLINLLDSNADIAAVQPKILSYKNKNAFEFAGAAGGFIDKFGYPFCRGRIFNSVENDLQQYDNSCDIFWATGACMMIRKKIFESMNGFDEEFFAHMEEIDLCWRMQHAGYRIHFEPKSMVYHVGGGTLATGNPRKTYYNFRNVLFMLHKNLPEKHFYFIMIIKLILDGVAAIKFVFTDGIDHFKAVWNAHRYFFRNVKKRKQLRIDEQHKIVTHNLTGLYYGVVVVDYFLKKKTRFSDLNKSKFS